MTAILKHELKSYFHSLTAYVFGAFLLVMAGPVDGTELTNLYSILEPYGVTPVDGIVVEADREHYTVEPYILLPDLNSHDITDPLIEENYYINMPLTQGLSVEDASVSVTALLTTSEESFSKVAGYDLSTYEKEDGDIDGPFAAAVSIDCTNDGQIVWFGSSVFLEDLYNALSSGSNSDLAMNALSDLIGEREALADALATEFTSEAPTQKEEIRLTLHLDSEAYPQTELVFYRYDGDSCLAVVDGSSWALVPREAVVDLIEAVNAIVL